jgi:hypothetical protein
MVADPGATPRPDAVRPLNRPRPLTVLVERGADGGPIPVALVEGGRRREVERVEEVWCVEDEWWHRRIGRRYYRLTLAGGAVRTVFHDLEADAWYAQSY